MTREKLTRCGAVLAALGAGGIAALLRPQASHAQERTPIGPSYLRTPTAPLITTATASPITSAPESVRKTEPGTDLGEWAWDAAGLAISAAAGAAISTIAFLRVSRIHRPLVDAIATETINRLGAIQPSQRNEQPEQEIIAQRQALKAEEERLAQDRAQLEKERAGLEVTRAEIIRLGQLLQEKMSESGKVSTGTQASLARALQGLSKRRKQPPQQ